MVYSELCAAARALQGRAHVLVKLVPQLCDPGHPVEQLTVASTLPVQKLLAVSVALFPLFSLKKKSKDSVRNTTMCFPLIHRMLKEDVCTLKSFAVHHLHMCIQICSGFTTEGSRQGALSTSLGQCIKQ